MGDWTACLHGNMCSYVCRTPVQGIEGLETQIDDMLALVSRIDADIHEARDAFDFEALYEYAEG